MASGARCGTCRPLDSARSAPSGGPAVLSLVQGLGSRFDSARLRPALPGQSRPTAGPSPRAQALRGVLNWCHLGAGPARRSLWRPTELPQVERRLAVALTGSLQSAQDACLQIDGSWLLQDCAGAAARLALRLSVKCHDALWWRARASSDPWDSGFALSASALAGFKPRRATLIVIESDTIDSALQAVAELHARQAQLPHAVRVLIVSGQPAGAWAAAWRGRGQVLPDWNEVSALD